MSVKELKVYDGDSLCPLTADEQAGIDKEYGDLYYFKEDADVYIKKLEALVKAVGKAGYDPDVVTLDPVDCGEWFTMRQEILGE